MKKFFTLILLALLPLVANAYDAKIDGIYYDFSGDEATVTYMYYSVYTTDLYHSDYSGDIVIPESVTYNNKIYSVTQIDGYTFYKCSDLISVTIPNSVISIGYQAFGSCKSLTSVVIGNSVTSIGNYAFQYCSNLTSVTLPNSVTFIGNSAFYCSGLIFINIPNSITSIGGEAFYGCSNLTSVTIGSGVTSIGDGAFGKCDSLKKTIWLTNTPPAGYTNANGTINYVTSEQYTELKNKVVYPFLNSLFAVDGIYYVPVNPTERTCDAIDCVYDERAANTKISPSVSYRGITMNVQRVQPYICYNNKYIKNLYCEYNGNIESNSFYGCTGIESIVCSNNGDIEQETFKGSTSITSIVLNNNGDIKKEAFKGCTSITSVECNNSGAIGNYAFTGCLSLKTLLIGSQVSAIGKETFSGCTSLTQIVSKAVTPPVCGELAFRDINIWSCTLTVPKGSLANYQEADQWKEFLFIEEDDSYVEPDPDKKCATPTISYKNGMLTYKCETEDAICQSTITDTDITSYSGNEVQLSVTYTVSVYATKDGYNNSDTVTATLCWIDVEPQTEGLTDDNATQVTMMAVPVLIQTQDGTISIQGASEGTPIAIYDIDGKQYGTGFAEKGCATIGTSLRAGSIAVVKIGEKSIKVLVK